MARLTGSRLRAFATLVERVAPARALVAHLAIGRTLREGPVPDASLAPTTSAVVPRHADADSPESDIPLHALATARAGRVGYATIAQHARAFRSGALDPVDLLDEFVRAQQHSDAQQPPLRAFLEVFYATARAEAEASRARHKAGAPLSILDGVPVCVKDQVNVRGVATTGGSRRAFWIADDDSTIIARLRTRGAIIVGRNTMHELGLGATGFSPVGTARNPWDPRHASGGSSSGTSVAVAAGLVPIAVGSDGGGSIRLPASLCGIVGLKPTFGRISKTGTLGIVPTFGHFGPMTPSVVDNAVLFAALAGRDPRDPPTLHQPPLNGDALVAALQARDLRGVKIGVDRAWCTAADAPILARFEELLELLGQRGAVVVELDIPPAFHARAGACHAVLAGTEVSAFLHARGMPMHELAAATRLAPLLASGLPASLLDDARRLRQSLRAEWVQRTSDVDVVASPSTATVAPLLHDDLFAGPSPDGEIDVTTLQALSRFTTHGNLFGHPGIGLPMGFVGALPFGLQLQGRDFDEIMLYRVAAVVEDLVRERWPDEATRTPARREAVADLVQRAAA